MSLTKFPESLLSFLLMSVSTSPCFTIFIELNRQRIIGSYKLGLSHSFPTQYIH